MSASDKREVRRQVLTQRNSLTPESVAAKSAAIIGRLQSLPPVRDAGTLMLFLAFGSELETDDLIRWGWTQGKRIAVPLCRPEERELMPCLIGGFDDLETGHYGIREPRAAGRHPLSDAEIDAVIVPAVAYDRRGFRVGYGGGYYDRFLRRAVRAVRIGAAFALQVVGAVPVDPHDLPVDLLVTEGEVIDCAEIRLKK